MIDSMWLFYLKMYLPYEEELQLRAYYTKYEYGTVLTHDDGSPHPACKDTLYRYEYEYSYLLNINF